MERRASLHQWQRLGFVDIESRCFVPVKQEFSKFGDILFGGREGETNLVAGLKGPGWA